MKKKSLRALLLSGPNGYTVLICSCCKMKTQEKKKTQLLGSILLSGTRQKSHSRPGLVLELTYYGAQILADILHIHFSTKVYHSLVICHSGHYITFWSLGSMRHRKAKKQRALQIILTHSVNHNYCVDWTYFHPQQR